MDIKNCQGMYDQVRQFVSELIWGLDWFLQRRHFIKELILPEGTKLRGLKSLEDLYEELLEEAVGSGENYGRPTILEAKRTKRLAERGAVEAGTEGESTTNLSGSASKRSSQLKSMENSMAAVKFDQSTTAKFGDVVVHAAQAVGKLGKQPPKSRSLSYSFKTNESRQYIAPRKTN